MKRKFFKGFLITISSLVFLLLGILLIAPGFFKDDIHALIVQEIDENIKGKVAFSDFSISCIRDFPDATFIFKDVSIVADSAGNDTLLITKELRLVTDLNMLWGNKDLEINEVSFKKPLVTILEYRNGKNNFDIIKENKSDTSRFAIKLDEWLVADLSLRYKNFKENYQISIDGFNAEGDVVFNNLINIKTTGTANSFSYISSGLAFIKEKKVSVASQFDIDTKSGIIHFNSMNTSINNLVVDLTGKIIYGGNDIIYDLAFDTGEDDFKDLVSVFPGIYPEDMKDFGTAGKMAFQGFIKGIYNDSVVPGYDIKLKIVDGKIKYHNLPQDLNNIQLDLLLKNDGGKMENTSLDLKHMHFDLGKNPFRGAVRIDNLKNFKTKAEIKAKIDLAHLAEIFPIEDFQFAGLFSIDVKVNGEFIADKKILPSIDAKIDLKNGFAKSMKYPVTLEKIHLNGEIKNEQGLANLTAIRLDTFTYTMDNEPFVVEGSVSDLEKLSFDLFMKGKFNLEKIAQILDLETYKCKGQAETDIEAKGNFSDLAKMELNGLISLNDVFLSSPQIPNGLKVKNGSLKIDKDKIFLNEVNASFAGSDFKVHGHLFDYLSLFRDDKKDVRGDMMFFCDSLNVNSWTSNYIQDSIVIDTSKATALRIPQNIDFIFDSEIAHLVYADITINNLKGEIAFHNGKMTINETGFNAIGSTIKLDGYYDTKPENIAFNFELYVNDLDINAAYKNFSVVRTMAPAAEHTYGLISLKYILSGEHDEAFNLNYKSLKGEGVLSISEAKINGMKLFSHLGHVSKKEKLKNPVLNSIEMKTKINNGRLEVQPFIFKLAGFDAEVEGFSDFAGEMKFICRIEFLKDKLKIPFHVEGKYNEPVVRIGKGHEESIATLAD